MPVRRPAGISALVHRYQARALAHARALVGDDAGAVSSPASLDAIFSEEFKAGAVRMLSEPGRLYPSRGIEIAGNRRVIAAGLRSGPLNLDLPKEE
ncbi:MAG: hypothetical protein H0W08_20205 [Acidobacteria bacterium]|nr:hypothetical protein [Acidobacteriota bacterium]